MATLTLTDGRTVRHHDELGCFGDTCCFHAPSNHPMVDLPYGSMVNIDTLHGNAALMYRQCEHQELHPDPDSLAYVVFMGPLPGSRAKTWQKCKCLCRCCDGTTDNQVADTIASLKALRQRFG